MFERGSACGADYVRDCLFAHRAKRQSQKLKYRVVDTNMGDPENKPFPLNLIMTRKRGFAVVRRVRLLQLEQLYRSAGLIA
jgi:hypothetical protein